MKIVDYLTAKPARFFLVAALFWMALMNVLNNKMGIQWKDILVEANGMAFDLLVFGILLSVYEAYRAKKDRIEQAKNLIDDLRGWVNEEGVLRTVAAIKRLNKEGVTVVMLNHCFLKAAYLQGANLSRASLMLANLSRANFAQANLSRAFLFKANISGADLWQADLSQANLSEANLSEATLLQAKLLGTNLLRANLSDANLSLIEVEFGWFEKLEEWEVIGREEIFKKYQIVVDEHGDYRLKKEMANLLNKLN